MARIARVLLVVSAPLFGCSDNDSNKTPVASQEIDASGGTISVTTGVLAGTELVVPPNSISETTTISIFEDETSTVPSELTVGPAARFSPESTAFDPLAILTLPFDPMAVPPGATQSDFVVKSRVSTGQISELTPQLVDLTNGLVDVDVDGLSTYWVAVRDVFVSAEYLPLETGNSYTFDNGFVLTVFETSNEPNFIGVPMFKLTWTGIGVSTGLYLQEDFQGAIDSFGDFWISSTVINEQQRDSAPWLFLDACESVGTVRDSIRGYTVFSPYGRQLPARTGISDVMTSFPGRGAVATPLGTFNDTVRVEFRGCWTETPPGPRGAFGMTTATLCLARGVGPVAYRFNGQTEGRLVSGTVGGQPIVPQ